MPRRAATCLNRVAIAVRGRERPKSSRHPSAAHAPPGLLRVAAAADDDDVGQTPLPLSIDSLLPGRFHFSPRSRTELDTAQTPSSLRRAAPPFRRHPPPPLFCRRCLCLCVCVSPGVYVQTKIHNIICLYRPETLLSFAPIALIVFFSYGRQYIHLSSIVYTVSSNKYFPLLTKLKQKWRKYKQIFFSFFFHFY